MSWKLLTEVAAVSSRIRQLEQFVNGGFLTTVLVELGDVHAESAMEHIQEAASSPRPDVRLREAAAELQTAYGAYDKAAGRGIRLLRRVNAYGLQEVTGKAAGTAGAVALLRSYAGEPASPQRKWLDRVAKHASLGWHDAKAWNPLIKAGATNYMLGTPDDSFQYAVLQALKDYYLLESQILPVHLVRPLPLAWTATGLVPGGPRYGVALDFRSGYRRVLDFSAEEVLPALPTGS